MSSHFFAFNEIRAATASDEDPFYPVANLLEHPTYKEYRSQTSEAVVVLDLSLTTPVDSFLLCGNNASGEIQATTLRLEANTTNSWDEPAFTIDHELTPDNQLSNLVYLSFESQSFRYWRLTIQNVGGLYAGASNIFIGRRIELSVDIGYTFRMVSRSEVNKGRYGQRFIDKLPDLREFDCAMSTMNQVERNLLDSIIHKCSTHTPLWMVLSPGLSLYEAGYFYFAETPEIENAAYQLYNASFTLEEVV